MSYSFGRSRRAEHLTRPVMYRIARMLLVDGLTPAACASELRHLGVTESEVVLVRAARLNRDTWIDVIADLGRQGLLI